MSERLSAEMLDYYKRLAEEGKNFHPARVAHLLAELDAVTRERDEAREQLENFSKRGATPCGDLAGMNFITNRER